MSNICPGCAEPVVRKRPTNLGGWSHTVEPSRLKWAHRNGDALCPEMTSKGYQPYHPKKES